MKTITVRAAVAYSRKKGDWVIYGGSHISDEEILRDYGIGFDVGPEAQITYITAEIPIHEPAEVQAEVEK